MATVNPFRYRGYYYDAETGMYYLQSRYYNPQTGRFLNADGYINANGDILGYNLFTYCGNNPVMGCDPTGNSFAIVLGLNFNFWGYGIVVSLSLVSTNKNLGIQVSYHISDKTSSGITKPEKSGQKSSTIGVDLGPYVGIQYTEKQAMEDLEGPSKAVGGDLLLGGDLIMTEDGKYLGWQYGASLFSANMHTIYSNTKTVLKSSFCGTMYLQRRIFYMNFTVNPFQILRKPCIIRTKRK